MVPDETVAKLAASCCFDSLPNPLPNRGLQGIAGTSLFDKSVSYWERLSQHGCVDTLETPQQTGRCRPPFAPTSGCGSLQVCSISSVLRRGSRAAGSACGVFDAFHLTDAPACR